MSRFSFTISLSLVAALAGCSSPDLEGTVFSCEVDADCTGGTVCGERGGAKVCIQPNTDELVIGMSAPLEGPNAALGIEMKRGVDALFRRVNTEGGVFNRPLRLEALNDDYDPEQALENTKTLLDIVQEVPDLEQPDVRGENAVFALLGNVGTPTMLETAPLATKNQTVFFAPFTGAQRYLRDGTDSPYVYNLRAGYYQETDAIVDYLSTTRTPAVITGTNSYDRILAFTQNDSYGDAGYLGLVNSYNSRVGQLPQPDPSSPSPSIRRVNYDPQTMSVTNAVAQTQDWLRTMAAPSVKVSLAIVMVDTHVPGALFIKEIKTWINSNASYALYLDVTFIHLSFVGADALVDQLSDGTSTYVDLQTSQRRTFAEGVMVTQVVPSPRGTLPGIVQYRADLESLEEGAAPTFTSLEGYMAAKLFVEALKLNGPAIDTDNLIHTLDTKIVGLDVGMGIRLDFDAMDHQASDTVWGSEIQPDGTFKVPFVWDPDNGIVTSTN